MRARRIDLLPLHSFGMLSGSLDLLTAQMSISINLRKTQFTGLTFAALVCPANARCAAPKHHVPAWVATDYGGDGVVPRVARSRSI